jgi:expansin (peptidoglycan-binding protein)
MRHVVVLLAIGCGGSTEPNAPGGDCTVEPIDAAGEATYYDADGSGNCSFDASADLMVAAMNAVDYGTADWCGGCVEVAGPMGSVVVRIVDQCPGCAQGDVDLSREAFERIAPLSAGRVPITWHEVACEVRGPVSYHFKDGANEFWTAIQVRDHRYPIATLEVLDGDAYRAIPRLEYNYFVDEGGLGEGPYTLRVTDSHGQVIEDTGIALGDDVTRAGAGQFASCSGE